MNTLIQKFSDVINGYISGFDRIVFKGSIMSLMHEKGAANFCGYRNILNKDFKGWMLSRTAGIVTDAENLSMRNCGVGIMPITSSRHRKESLAHDHQLRNNISSGLIGVWSAVESCVTFKARYDKTAGFPRLSRHWGKCKHLYFYYDHEDYGFMNIRLQTWFPYHIQIAMNGREWLRRSLEKIGVDHSVKGNKFSFIDDYQTAQRILDEQRNSHWTEILSGLLPDVFPSMKSVVGEELSYYWTLWQSELATDMIFDSPRRIDPFIDTMLRYALMTGSFTNVMRYMDRPLTSRGVPRSNCSDEYKGRAISFNDGLCLRFWLNGNSVKIYNEANVIRTETTTHNPSMFKAHRHKKGDSEETPKKLRGLRKSVADTPLTAAKAQQVNDRFMNHLAQCEDETPAAKIFAGVSKAKKKDGRRIRALDVTGKDRALIQAISTPKFSVSGMTNHALREILEGEEGYAGKTEKQLSSKVSRQLRMLRDHGLIKKMPRQNRYQLTPKGQQVTAVLNATLAASTQQLMKMAA